MAQFMVLLHTESPTGRAYTPEEIQTVVQECRQWSEKMVTVRQPNDELFRNLSERLEAGVEGAPKTLRRIGDCEAPAIIAAAVYSGHRYAGELDCPESNRPPVPHYRILEEHL